jgi:hypothetical protein
VAIGLRPYVVDDLASGRLVAPFKLAVPKGQACISFTARFGRTMQLSSRSAIG